MADLSSIYAGIGLGQGLGSIPESYTMGRKAAEESAMNAIRRQAEMEALKNTRVSREKAMMQMNLEEQERQDAIRRAEMAAKSLFPPMSQPQQGITPTPSGMGAKTGITSGETVEPSAMSLMGQTQEPEVTEFNRLKNIMDELKKRYYDPNASEEARQATVRDIAFYSSKIPTVQQNYRNLGYRKIANFASNPSSESLTKIKPIIQELFPDIGNISLETVPAIGDDGEPIKGKFTNQILTSIKDEKGSSILVPIDPRMLTTMGDPEKINDVLSKVESARQQRINAFAISEREIRRLEMSQNKSDQDAARRLKEQILSMSPAWLAIKDETGKIVGYEPLLGTKRELENNKIEQMRPRFAHFESKLKQDDAIRNDPEFKEFSKSIINNPRLK